MIIGKVVGSVVSTDKDSMLVGHKFMIVEAMASTWCAKRIVAVDDVGAGIGDKVLVTLGSAARFTCDGENDGAPIDAAIVGIIDSDCVIPDFDK